jgi:hypothetical protein
MFRMAQFTGFAIGCQFLLPFPYTLMFVTPEMFVTSSVKRDFLKFVDPMIGSDGHGHVFVGANAPRNPIAVGIGAPAITTAPRAFSDSRRLISPGQGWGIWVIF